MRIHSDPGDVVSSYWKTGLNTSVSFASSPSTIGISHPQEKPGNIQFQVPLRNNFFSKRVFKLFYGVGGEQGGVSPLQRSYNPSKYILVPLSTGNRQFSTQDGLYSEET